jgi:hypothetical protein
MTLIFVRDMSLVLAPLPDFIPPKRDVLSIQMLQAGLTNNGVLVVGMQAFLRKKMDEQFEQQQAVVLARVAQLEGKQKGPS